ncbi:MAG: helix-turn-helix domain-containing protein [Pseudotabrizicola sp.]|jgi:DNA-binding HxlR family transcriptional regulator|uniref:winged helix-turn-helix transcriptional regulator n=1 Tax=Pseudotabrizicola sp. TaxID=2939647 RepID=UPI002718EC63|nr:helix-turn-helix domain-containing protein [Pseudotabrizicola sp.]MDO8884968.1 helix-turn-helix domain-containing protein [Pseudotabrizicola sp.]MDP2080535.1 helix-turn-helix domain-containing protein [Pseudotabrizicola sp.]MDZ7573263.1 helix-turn-helix domain-containing protein [Pseudotabrizicola sp.]
MTPSDTAHVLISRWKTGNVLAADCPSRVILQHLTSKWGTLVMVTLATGPHRFAQLRRRIAGVSERMLAQTLQQLEADGFVLRVARDVVPPHVIYSLTPLGTEAAVPVMALTGWIEANLSKICPSPPQSAQSPVQSALIAVT